MTDDALWQEARELDDAYDADTKNDAARMARLALSERRVSEAHLAFCRLAAKERDFERVKRDAAEARVADLGCENAELRAVVAEVEALADEWDHLEVTLSRPRAYANELRAALSGAPAALAEVKADAWDEGYARGVRDSAWDMEPADNPYRQDGAR